MERKLADMDSRGIDIAVLSLGAPGPELIGSRGIDRITRARCGRADGEIFQPVPLGA